MQVSGRRLVHSILQHTPDLVVYRVEVWAVWRLQVWGDELRHRAREKVDDVASTMLWYAILLEDKVISSDLSYCWHRVFRQQLISVIGATDLSPGLDENQLRAPELGHGDRHHQPLAKRWTCTE